MDTSDIILLLGVTTSVLLLAAMMILLLKRTSGRRASPDETGQGFTLLQQQIDALRQQTSETLSSNNAAIGRQLADLNNQMGQRLDATTHIVQQVSTSLGGLSQATERMLEVGREVSSLNDILKTPKLRGNIGELFLGDLLGQVVPRHHELQHRFRSGETVDAVVRLGPRLVPIDAKFPLEDFRRLLACSDEKDRKPLKKAFTSAVRKHVDAIAGKYVRPDEGTFDFALMYIPAENVYYETIIKDDAEDNALSSYAMSRRVIPVSPNSLYAYLQTVVLGLRGLQVEERAQEILEHLVRLQQDFAKFKGDFEIVGTHLKNAGNRYDEAARRLGRFEDRLAISPGMGENGTEPTGTPGR